MTTPTLFPSTELKQKGGREGEGAGGGRGEGGGQGGMKETSGMTWDNELVD